MLIHYEFLWSKGKEERERVGRGGLRMAMDLHCCTGGGESRSGDRTEGYG